MEKFIETVEANKTNGSGFSVDYAKAVKVELEQMQNAGLESSNPIPLPESNLPIPELDEKLLPEVWREWLSDIAERLQCPLDYAVVSALVAAASLVGNRIRIKPKKFDSWLVVPNVWGAIVGIPGVMKTPAVNEGLVFFREIAEKERLNFEENL
jgi:putative DNA primase/helicase